MQRRWALGLGLLLAVGGACGSEEEQPLPGPPAGSERGPCYGNGTCNQGLVCLSQLCVRPSGDAGPDDASAEDSGVVDLGTGDSGVDTGVVVDGGEDAAIVDGAGLDAEPTDTLDSDAGPSDQGPTEVGVDVGNPDGGPSDVGGPDGGPTDLGAPDVGNADGGPFDLGIPDVGNLDAGTFCDPVAGGPCFPPGACHWPAPLDFGVCQPVAPPPLGFEAPCDLGNDQCGVGLTCMFLQGEAAPSCHRVCYLSSGQGCENLQGSAPSYTCGSISGSQNYGACLPAGTLCDPLAPVCPAGAVCTFIASQTSCEPAGPGQLGDPCSLSQNCAAGQGMCFDTGNGGFCRQVCDPATPGPCGPGANCVGITGQPYGACFPIGCTAFSNPCPNGQTCSSLTGSLECRPAGPGQPGDTCDLNNECQSGAICLLIGGNTGQCFDPCDANNPCTQGQCFTITGLDFGVCF